MTGDETAALRELASFYRSAAVELLIREYRWTGGAAAGFVAALDREAAATAERARAVRRELTERREQHENETTGSQETQAG